MPSPLCLLWFKVLLLFLVLLPCHLFPISRNQFPVTWFFLNVYAGCSNVARARKGFLRPPLTHRLREWAQELRPPAGAECKLLSRREIPLALQQHHANSRLLWLRRFHLHGDFALK